jgi:hypothetical protein
MKLRYWRITSWLYSRRIVSRATPTTQIRSRVNGDRIELFVV